MNVTFENTNCKRSRLTSCFFIPIHNMNNKPFHGRAIYQPSGAAGEYSQWACNLFNGCSNRCDYCYNRHSMTSKVLGADKVTLKKSLEGSDNSGFIPVPIWKKTILREIKQNREAIIRDGGLFLSFVSDPMLPETIIKTRYILRCCSDRQIPVTILTKSAWWRSDEASSNAGHARLFARKTRIDLFYGRKFLSLGFTLTGMEEMERHCISNTQERIAAMKWAHKNGIRTWASIEPVIDFDRALDVISLSLPFCQEYRIGLASKLGITYTREAVLDFKQKVEALVGTRAKLIWKKSILDKIK